RRRTSHGIKKKRMVKRRHRRQSRRYLDLLPFVESLKAEHPAWGYRRITAYLRKYVDQTVNHKGIALLLKSNGLAVPRKDTLRARRAPKTRKPVTDTPNDFWGTDMTKILTSVGWCYVHVVIDWGSKKLLALLASLTSNSSDWIAALDLAVNLQFPDGIRTDVPGNPPPQIVSDNGCQPASRAYAAYEKALGLQHVFTSFCNPKGTRTPSVSYGR
ncbi:MAG: DDE-type integrase/transposase/recombinase, partial [Oligosphaeraceae bacterium]